MAVFLEQKKIHCESWLASVIIGSPQVLEKYQMESLGSLQSQLWTSSILQELPQPCLHPMGGHTGSTWELILHSPFSSQVTSLQQ